MEEDSSISETSGSQTSSSGDRQPIRAAGDLPEQPAVTASLAVDSAADSAGDSQAEHPGLIRPRAVTAIIALLMLFAATRVSFVAVSHPFFCHLDELAHVDTMFKYADGRWPVLGRDHYDEQTLILFQTFNSPEYGLTADNPELILHLEHGIPGSWSKEHRELNLKLKAHERVGHRNHEAFQPPIYYLAAGAWWHLGKALGLDQTNSLYWVRCLGGLFLGLLVLTSYRFIRRVCPDRPFLWLGTPILIAFLPQDVFAFINNDVAAAWMVPLCLEQLYIIKKQGSTKSRQVLVGLLVAAALLAKPTNLTLLFAGACIFLPHCVRRIRSGDDRLLSSYKFLWLGAGIPLGSWAIYAMLAMGEVTGTDHKVGMLGFMPQTWENFVRHPLFTFDGLWTYFEHLLPGFWRGDLFWYGEVSRILAMDAVYSVTTVIFLGASILSFGRAGRLPRIPSSIQAACWIALVSGVATLMVLSLSWDFAHNTYPSRDFPYFSNGRLLTSLIMPFMLLYLNGMERVLHPIGGKKLVWGCFAILIMAIIGTEIATLAEAYASPWNFWHLTVL